MLHIQDPTFDGNKLLHEALLDACSEASYGAGAYAFVTSGGVRMLMEDAIFADFISQGRYHLVIGMDEVTNTQTLSALTSVRQHTNNLSINAFVHDTNGSTFHPKFSWFKTNDGGVIVVGSGNLTQKGLRRNREAFVFQHVSEEEIAQVEATWNQWITSSAEYLKTITLVSGHCPKGGVDIWAEEIADVLGIKKEIYPAEVNQWNDKVIIDPKSYDEHIITGAFHVIARMKKLKGFRSRNIQIAEACDVLYCIVPRTLPQPSGNDFSEKLYKLLRPTFKDAQKERIKGQAFCKHCNQFGHPTNGGCWTMKYAKKLGKETHLVVIE